MNLKEMLREFGDLIGRSPDVPEDRESMIRKLNNAARQMWQGDDLPNSLQSIVIEATESNTISFPEFVGQLRGVRKCRVHRKVIDQAARFVDKMPEGYLTPTVLYKSPVSDTGVDFTNLRVEFAEAVMGRIVVTIHGATAGSNSEREQLIFGNGDRIKALTKSYVSITSVHKDALTGPDMRIISDVDDELCMVPSNANTSSYIVYQLVDCPTIGCDPKGLWGAFELYYKPVLRLFSDDSDTFQAEGSEMALVYLATSLVKLQTAGPEAEAQARAYANMSVLNQRGAQIDDAIGKIHMLGNVRSGFPRLRQRGSAGYWKKTYENPHWRR